MTAMAVSSGALDGAVRFIAREEGLRRSVYIDQAGLPTIGYGHRCVADHPDISEWQANALLRADVARSAESLRGLVLTDNQAVAVLSLVYNIGRGAFVASTMRRKLLDGDVFGAAEQFGRWKFVRQGPRMVESAGLIARRARERALFERG